MIVDEVMTEENTSMFNDEPDQKTESSSLDELMSKALTQGYLLADDLLAAFPEAEDSMSQLEEIFIQLVSQGIDVYNDAAEAEEEQKRLKEQQAPRCV